MALVYHECGEEIPFRKGFDVLFQDASSLPTGSSQTLAAFRLPSIVTNLGSFHCHFSLNHLNGHLGIVWFTILFGTLFLLLSNLHEDQKLLLHGESMFH